MNDTNNELIKLGLKRLYIVDNTSHIFDLSQLRESLINDIKRDTIENGSEDSDIIKYNLELLEKLYSNDNYKYNEDFIIEELKAFGYRITKVDSITSNLLELKYFMESNNKKDIVDKIDVLLKEICNYFND